VTIAATLTSAAGLSDAFVFAFFPQSAARQTLAQRDLTSWGGYASLGLPCAADTVKCGTKSCCPTGWTCNTDRSTDAPLCCPTSTDCSDIVRALPACADNSWGLFSFAGAFCCVNGTTGTWSGGPGNQCLSKDLPIPTDIALTTVRLRPIAASCSSRCWLTSRIDQAGHEDTERDRHSISPDDESLDDNDAARLQSRFGVRQ